MFETTGGTMKKIISGIIFGLLIIIGGNKLIGMVTEQPAPKPSKKLSKLKKLDLSKSNLTTFPVHILTLINLKGLNLSNNQIPAIPEGINQLEKLRKLNISNNLLTAFPDSTLALKNLEEFSISNNKIPAIPEDITKLTKLRKLNISFNQFTTFPMHILQIASLEKLTVSEREIDTMPGDKTFLEKLATLNTTFGKKLTIEIFREPKFIKILSARRIERGGVSYKPLEIPENAFKKLTINGYLLLGENGIKTLKPGIFQGFTANGLSLENNKIETLQPKTFQGLTVNKLILATNQIKIIQPEAFQGAKVKGDLDLSEQTQWGIYQLVIKPKAFQGLILEGNLDLSFTENIIIEPGAFEGILASPESKLILEDTLLSKEQIKAAQKEFEQAKVKK